MKRREFLENTSYAAGALMFLQCKIEEYKKLGDFGIQLWSVRDLMADDPATTLKVISDIGYTDVECAGYYEGRIYDLPKKEFGSLLNDLGLTMRSSHVGTGFGEPDRKGTMTNGWESFCEDIKSLGGQSVVCGYFQEEERKSLDDYKRHAELFNKCGEKAKEYDLQFAHHNHDFEFFPIDGKVPYDVLLEETDPGYVKFEMDHYWVRKADANPFEYFDKYPGRFPFWHVKDMDDTEERFFTEVGSGIIDWVQIFQKADQSGLKYFYVEQDDFRTLEPLLSIKQSHDFLKKLYY
ncbi:MAG: sugar phosphate isomerase/epimerase [Bacteroidia bacterium]|nr:sugar phosphate isomerase/epimerase [Bacteroidia bacterium]